MEALDKLKSYILSLNLSQEETNEFKALSSELEAGMQREQFILEKQKQNQRVTAKYLSRTIEELEDSNRQLRNFQKIELEQKQKLIEFKEKQLNQIISTSPYALSFIDSSFTYVFANEIYNTWFGSNPTGSKVIDLVGEDIFNSTTKPCLTQALAGHTVIREVKIKNMNDEEMVLEVTYAPALDQSGINIGAYVFATNITDLKKVHQELEEKNEELNKYISSNLQLENFAHLASHDLSAPLNNIINFSQLMKTRVTYKLDEEENKYLDFICRAAINMEKTIKSLLDFSIVSNQKPIFASFSPREMLESLLEDISQTLKEKKASVHVEELPDQIIADKILLRQLFQNLILNGIKFQEGKPPKIEIFAKEEPDRYWFYVKDNGIGIEAKFLEKIFLVFQRLHNRQSYPGTGIGLAISRKIVNHHLGEIFVDSTIGNGSTFYFSISKKLKNKS